MRKPFLVEARFDPGKGRHDLQPEQVHKLLDFYHTMEHLGKVAGLRKDYFAQNQHRMATMKAMGLPLGSGSVESAIRRIVNLRLKAPCTSWYKENAAKRLLLRPYYKAGRWNLLKQMANSSLTRKSEQRPVALVYVILSQTLMNGRKITCHFHFFIFLRLLQSSNNTVRTPL